MSPPAFSPLFFFSSRRRHTRLQGDWSSDVCSSDLSANIIRGSRRAASFPAREARRSLRSEERRVGKECRSRGWAYSQKKHKQQDDNRKCLNERQHSWSAEDT